MGVVVATVLTLGPVGIAQTDPWLGQWKSVDLDGSNQTLTITRRADGAYRVSLFDDRAGVCGGAAANGDGVGTVAGNVLTGTTVITCASGQAAGTFPFRGTYNPGNDTFTDGLGVVWTRVKKPPTPKVRPLPLGRLVLAPPEAPGLKQRAAKAAAAKQALARAVRPRKLPAFAPRQTQVAHFTRAGIDLWSLAFVMRNVAAARSAAAALARIGKPGLVTWRRGHIVAAIVLTMRDRRRVTVARIGADYAVVGRARIVGALSRTAWTHVLDKIGPNGQVSRATALDMFSVAYGPLPGRARPAGRASRVDDGTIAARHILRLWPSLTTAQRTAAARLIGIAGVKVVARSQQVVDRPSSRASLSEAIAAATYGDPGFVQNAELQKQSDAFAKAISAKLNRPLELTIVAGGTTSPVTEAAADATRMDESGNYSVFGTICRIRLTKIGQAGSLAFRNMTIAHEVFHCFQYDITDAQAAEMADWVIEGMADWAGLDLVPTFDAGDSYVQYLDTCRTKPLFSRSYDAVGFFGHVDDSLGSFWPRAVSTLNAAGPIDTEAGNVASFGAAGGQLEQFLDTWAASVLLRPDLGPAWYATKPLPFKPGLALCPAIPIIDSTTGIVTPYRLQLFRIEPAVPKDRPLLHVKTVRGNARLGDGVAIDTAELRDAWFCVGQKCECPPGTEGFPPPAPPLSLPAYVGITGGSGGAIVHLEFVSLDDYCKVRQKPPPVPCPLGRSVEGSHACPPGGHSPPGPGEPPHDKDEEDPPDPLQCFGHGCGRSIADPHLAPFDSPWYDFQGVGEFTLVKSTTDDLEIQVRQRPWPGSKIVSQNVAVAMRVAGDRVGVYSGDPLVVRVNGQPVVLGKKDLRLPRGGAIRPLRQGQIDVAWPDGSAVRVIPTGDLSTDVIVALAAARQGKVVGLLGNNDPAANDADDFTTRRGRRLDPKAVKGTGKRAYNLLYRVFGDSWRVTPKASLFDYARGQSTRTFTDRRFPARIASPEALKAQERRRAETVCKRMRIQDPLVFRNCVVDVASTGFFGFAVSASTAERSVRKARTTPPPPTQKPGATVRWGTKTYTYRPASSQDGCDRTGTDIRFEAEFTASPGKKLVYGFKLVVIKGTKDGVYTTGTAVLFEIEGGIPVEAQSARVTLAGKRTRGTFSGVASTPGKEPVSGSFRC